MGSVGIGVTQRRCNLLILSVSVASATQNPYLLVSSKVYVIPFIPFIPFCVYLNYSLTKVRVWLRNLIILISFNFHFCSFLSDNQDITFLGFA